MATSEQIVHTFRSAHDEAQGKKYLPPLAARGLVPEPMAWGFRSVTLRRGQPLIDWLRGADQAAVNAMRPHILGLIRDMHALGICHRDLHVENVIVLGGRPMAIDLEHACDVDPSWRCYDLHGPSAQIPLLPEHAQFGGVLGSHGIWWGAPRDPRWNGRYVPLGLIFGSL